jgi:hypothetical protein
MVGLLLCSTGAWASVIPIIQDGKLIGADNVKLGPLGLYKFRLARGSCRDIFANNCDPALFTFTNAQDATLAAQALLDQVFVGYYDDVPSATFGCSGNFGCQPYTPYRIDAVPYQWGYTDSSGSYAGTGYTRYVKAEMTSNWAKYFYFENFTPTGYPDEVLLTSGPIVWWVPRPQAPVRGLGAPGCARPGSRTVVIWHDESGLFDDRPGNTAPASWRGKETSPINNREGGPDMRAVRRSLTNVECRRHARGDAGRRRWSAHRGQRRPGCGAHL